MNASRIVAISVLGCLLGGGAAGCAWSIGEKKVESAAPCRTSVPTRGQELMDLKKAKDQGALTEEEYQAQKKKLMEK